MANAQAAWRVEGVNYLLTGRDWRRTGVSETFEDDVVKGTSHLKPTCHVLTNFPLWRQHPPLLRVARPWSRRMPLESHASDVLVNERFGFMLIVRRARHHCAGNTVRVIELLFVDF